MEYTTQYALLIDEGYFEMFKDTVVFNSKDYELSDLYDNLDEAITECKRLNSTSRIENGNDVVFTSVIEVYLKNDDIVEYGETVHDQARWELEAEYKELQNTTDEQH